LGGAPARGMCPGGTRVLLPTHYLVEPALLGASIGVIERGRAIAHGTPEQLKSQIGGDRIDVVLPAEHELELAAAVVRKATGAATEIDRDARRISAPVRDRIAALTELTRALAGAGVAAADIAVRRPTLDDVFLQLTGHGTTRPEVRS
ncbi:MAG: ATP-binding protein DrrA1-3 family domain-containing protein, partial [Kofleriaceae bacterium]